MLCFQQVQIKKMTWLVLVFPLYTATFAVICVHVLGMVSQQRNRCHPRSTWEKCRVPKENFGGLQHRAVLDADVEAGQRRGRDGESKGQS